MLSQEKVDEQFDNAAKYVASLCVQYNLNPNADIISHGELSKLGNVSGGHTDPHAYLGKWGHDVDGFRALVSTYM